MTREKSALFVLMFLVIIFVGVGISYVAHSGKTWNLAASVVDDTFGSMDGYSTIVYSGTVEPPAEPEFPLAQEDEALQEGEAAGQDESLDVASPDTAGDDLASLDASSTAAPSPLDDRAAREEIQNSVSNKFLPIIEMEEEKEPIYVSDVRALYEEKGASVLSLDTVNPSRYSTPDVFFVGGKRVGVFEVHSPLPATRMAEYSEFFASQGAEVVLCISPRRAYLETLEGVDIVVVTTPTEGYTTIGVNESDTFIVRTPEIGTVGVILITSSNVVSSKVISSLD